jgi:hypothetical protein
MLQFLSFIVTLALLGGVLGFMVMTIRNASETIMTALMPPTRICANFVNFDRQDRRRAPARVRLAVPLRAAA